MTMKNGVGENMLPKWITIKTQPFQVQGAEHFDSAKAQERVINQDLYSAIKGQYFIYGDENDSRKSRCVGAKMVTQATMRSETGTVAMGVRGMSIDNIMNSARSKERF